MKRFALVAALALLALGARGTDRFYGLTLGSSIADYIGSSEKPEVHTSDVGQIWTWHRRSGGINVTTRVTTNDDGAIEMLDVLARGATVGPELTMPLQSGASLTFGSAHAADADALFGAPEFEGAGAFPDGDGQASFRGYTLDGDREAVLLFDAKGGPLREMFWGMRTALGRAGVIPHEPAPDVFKAPSLRQLGSADFSSTNTGTAYVRIAVTATGSVSNAKIFISSGSNDLDNIAVAIARGSSFVPATRNGAAAPSIYFERQPFIVSGSGT